MVKVMLNHEVANLFFLAFFFGKVDLIYLYQSFTSSGHQQRINWKLHKFIENNQGKKLFFHQNKRPLINNKKGEKDIARVHDDNVLGDVVIEIDF